MSLKKFLSCFIIAASSIAIIVGGLMHTALDVRGNNPSCIVNIEENKDQIEKIIVFDYEKYLVEENGFILFPSLRHDFMVTIFNDTSDSIVLPKSRATLIYSKGEPIVSSTDMGPVYEKWWQYRFKTPGAPEIPLTPVAKFDNPQESAGGGVISDVMLFAEDICLNPGEGFTFEMSCYFDGAMTNPYQGMNIFAELAFPYEIAKPTTPTKPATP